MTTQLDFITSIGFVAYRDALARYVRDTCVETVQQRVEQGQRPSISAAIKRLKALNIEKLALYFGPAFKLDADAFDDPAELIAARATIKRQASIIVKTGHALDQAEIQESRAAREAYAAKQEITVLRAEAKTREAFIDDLSKQLQATVKPADEQKPRWCICVDGVKLPICHESLAAHARECGYEVKELEATTPKQCWRITGKRSEGFVYTQEAADSWRKLGFRVEEITPSMIADEI